MPPVLACAPAPVLALAVLGTLEPPGELALLPPVLALLELALLEEAPPDDALLAPLLPEDDEDDEGGVGGEAWGCVGLLAEGQPLNKPAIPITSESCCNRAIAPPLNGCWREVCDLSVGVHIILDTASHFH